MVDYLKSVKQEAPLKASFKHIQKDPIFKELKSTMLAGQHVFLIPQKVDENLQFYANKMNSDQEGVL